MIMGRNDELYESQLIPLMYCYFAEIGLDFTLSYSWRIVEIVKDKQSVLSEWQKSSTFNDAVWEARKYTFCKIMHCYGQQFLADCGNFVVDAQSIIGHQYVNSQNPAMGIVYEMKSSQQSDWLIINSKLPDGCKVYKKTLKLVRPYTFKVKEAILECNYQEEGSCNEENHSL